MTIAKQQMDMRRALIMTISSLNNQTNEEVCLDCDTWMCDKIVYKQQ